MQVSAHAAADTADDDGETVTMTAVMTQSFSQHVWRDFPSRPKPKGPVGMIANQRLPLCNPNILYGWLSKLWSLFSVP